MNEMPIPVGTPEQASTASLQERLKNLRSQLQPETKQDQAKLRKACQDFEAVFIGQIWKQMRSSVPKDGMLHSKEEENYLSMFDQELSVKMAGSGGIGLADMLYANLSERLVNASRDTASAKPLLPLDRAVLSRIEAEIRIPAVPTRTLAALTAQHEAEMLARNIETSHGSGATGKGLAGESSSADLEDALKMVSMDERDGI
jgi:flagellar protein FlgJ